MMVGIKGGKVELYGKDSKTSQTFDLTPEGALAFIRVAQKTPHLMTSSSCTWPAENGAPEDFDIDEWVESGHGLINRAIEILQGDRDV